jgi:hypothetical protein
MTKDEALKLALDWFMCYADGSMSRNNAENLADEIVDDIKAALAQPEREPVAWLGFNPRSGAPEFACDKPAPSVMRDYNMMPLAYINTTPPAAERTWVGLTEQEALDCFDLNPVIHSKNVEAKLRSKNYE